MSRLEKLTLIGIAVAVAGLLIGLLQLSLVPSWLQVPIYTGVFLILIFFMVYIFWLRKLAISFKQVKQAIDDLISYLGEQEFDPDYIVVPSGGGCVVAGLLQTEIGRKDMIVLPANREWERNELKSIDIYLPSGVTFSQRKVLLLDDIAYRMTTLMSVRTCLIDLDQPPEVIVAVIAKPTKSWLLKKWEAEKNEANKKKIQSAIKALENGFFAFAPYSHNGPKTVKMPWKTIGIP